MDEGEVLAGFRDSQLCSFMTVMAVRLADHKQESSNSRNLQVHLKMLAFGARFQKLLL